MSQWFIGMIDSGENEKGRTSRLDSIERATANYTIQSARFPSIHGISITASSLPIVHLLFVIGWILQGRNQVRLGAGPKQFNGRSNTVRYNRE